MEVFIPEIYVSRRCLLTHVDGYGYGYRLHYKDLTNAIKDGRIHPNVLSARDVIVITHPI